MKPFHILNIYYKKYMFLKGDGLYLNESIRKILEWYLNDP